MVVNIHSGCQCISCSRIRMADWELQLTATAQLHERAFYRILLAWKKKKIQSTVSVEYL